VGMSIPWFRPMRRIKIDPVQIALANHDASLTIRRCCRVAC
jgi:hypothetical protein